MRTTFNGLLRFIAVLSIATTFLATPGFADEGPGEERTLTTQDGWQIKITYYESSGGKESPVAILFPGVEGFEESRTRKVWDKVAEALQKEKYAVVTADLRKHGDSVPDSDDARATRLMTADYGLMVSQDLAAIKAFLVAEHQKEMLNIRKLGIATAGSGCLVATAFAANDWATKPWPDAPTLAARTPRGQDVRAIMMLSPKALVRGINAAQVCKYMADPVKGVAVHIYFNPSDRTEKSAAAKIHRYFKLPKDTAEARMLHEGPEDKVYSAEGLLQDKAGEVMQKKISEFFGTFVRDRPEAWKTRTSKLQ